MRECPRCRLCLDDTVGDVCPQDGTRLEEPLVGPPLIDGKYRLERRLGEGAMGRVYEARHLALEKRFALKLLSASRRQERFVERFRIEAKALGRLKHPHIVDVTDYGVDPREGGLPYLVMERLEGQTLKEMREEEGALHVETALPLFEALGRAIDHAHAQGVLHRDLKPSNVFVAEVEGAGARLKVLDFGLARLIEDGAAGAADSTSTDPTLMAHQPPDDGRRLAAPRQVSPGETGGVPGGRDSALTATGSIVGTPCYMAPELQDGAPASRASDFYSFGVLIYELLAGTPPFTGSVSNVLRSHVQDKPRAPSVVRATLPKELDVPLLAPLAKDPRRRPDRAADIVRSIHRAWLRALRRRWRAKEIPRRVLLAAGLAPALAVVAVTAGRLPVLQALEARTEDARFAWAPAHPPDSRLSWSASTTRASSPTPLPSRSAPTSSAVALAPCSRRGPGGSRSTCSCRSRGAAPRRSPNSSWSTRRP